tara:strand:+ start:221 stop:1453 length:1233 start_codon:yes stop_codon:yes gene_type:complete
MSNRTSFGITSFVQSVVAGTAQAAVRLGADSAIRSISGLNKEGNNSSLFSSNKSRFGTSLLSYPFDVETDTEQGHHILFTVRVIDPAKLQEVKARKTFAKIVRDISALDARQKKLDESSLGDTEDGAFEFNRQQAQLNVDRQILNFNRDIAESEVARTLSSFSSDLGTNRSIQRTSRPTRRTETTIALYMPPNVQVSYDVKYGDQPIGSLAQIGLEAIEAFRGGATVTASLKALRDNAQGLVREGATGFLNATLDTLAPGARALQQIDSGKVVTPRMELMFEGVGRRSFNYTFVFIPKSEQESIIVEKIIQAFKVNMMPEYTNATTRREMKIPNTFDIEYRYQNTENSFLNKISECFLTKADVQYGADRFTAYERTTGQHGTGAPAQKTTLTLAFTELEVLDKSSVEQGF